MKAGRLLVVLLLVVGVLGGLVSGATIYSRLLYLGSILGVGGWLWTRAVVSSLRFQRTARVERANVGDVFEENFELENSGRVFAPWVEIYNKSSLPFAAGSRLFTFVTSHQKRTYFARTWLTRRGGFLLGPTRISSGDPFGLFRFSREIAPTQTLIVLPILVEIRSFLFPPGLLPGGQVIRKKSADITPHAAGVREFVHGDAMKRIHWPTSIRRNQLMVKEFEQDPQAEIWLYLDAQKSVHFERPGELEEVTVESMLFGRRPKFQLPPSTLEYTISITASLAHYFIGQRRAVGFVSAGHSFNVHPAERSARQEAKILETLAFVEANGDLSLAALVSAQAAQLPQGSSAILVTPSTRAELLLAVDDLLRRYLRPVVILLDAESFGGQRGSDKLVRALTERRVPLCLIACDADISLALSELPSTITSRDLRSWQNPILAP